MIKATYNCLYCLKRAKNSRNRCVCVCILVNNFSLANINKSSQISPCHQGLHFTGHMLFPFSRAQLTAHEESKGTRASLASESHSLLE